MRTKCGQTCQVPKLLTQWNSRAQNSNWQQNKKRTEILKAAGCGQVHSSSKLATKLRARLSLSWTKQRQLRKISKSFGIKIDSEKKERNSQKDLMCANICVEQNAMYIFEKQQTETAWRKHLWHPPTIYQSLFQTFWTSTKRKKSWHGTTRQSLMMKSG